MVIKEPIKHRSKVPLHYMLYMVVFCGEKSRQCNFVAKM
jgi:hypothetical protein